MNASAQKALAVRDARLAAHGREGFRLASDDPAYRATVLARLAPDLRAEPADLWDAIPWIWAVVLGSSPPAGAAMTSPIVAAAKVLRDWLTGEEPLDTLEAGWASMSVAPLALGSTLRSHPFPDLRAWSIRPMFAASSLTPRGS